MREINDLNFEESLTNGLNILDFYTDYCEPCKALSPMLENLSKEFGSVNFLKVNATENRQTSRRFRVMSAPTIIFYKDNNVINVIHGLRSEEDLKETILQYI